MNAIGQSIKSNEPGKGFLYSIALLFTFSIGFSFFGIKKCIPYADTLTILTYRYVAAMLGTLIWLAVSRVIKGTQDEKPSRPKSRLYLTAALYIGFMIFQIFSMFFATSIEGAIVYAMVPIFAKVISRIALGERATWLQNFFVVITVVALMVLIVLNATSIDLNLTGIILMTIATFLFACQNVSARYVRGVFSPIEITKCIAIGGSLIFLPVSLIRAGVTNNYMALITPLQHPDFIAWAAFLGIFCMLFSSQCMAYMAAHMQIVQSSVFNSASTLVSIIAGAIILGEPLYWYHYICGALILAGVVGLIFAPVKAENSGKSLADEVKKYEKRTI